VAVFVDQATEDVDSLDVPGRAGVGGGGVRRRDPAWHWDVEVDAAVGACGVVMRQVCGQDSLKMAAADQQPSEAFGSEAPTPPGSAGIHRATGGS
jgi:hypothetical protein